MPINATGYITIKPSSSKQSSPRDHQSTPSNEILLARDQLTYSNSQPLDSSNQIPSINNHLLSTSNELLGGSEEEPEELSELSVIQPIAPNPIHHHTSNAPPMLINKCSLMKAIPTMQCDHLHRPAPTCSSSQN